MKDREAERNKVSWVEEWKLVSWIEKEISICDLDHLFIIFTVNSYIWSVIFIGLVSLRQPGKCIGGSEIVLLAKIRFCLYKNIIKICIITH